MKLNRFNNHDELVTERRTYKLMHCENGRTHIKNSRRIVFIKGSTICLGNFKNEEAALIGIRDFEECEVDK